MKGIYQGIWILISMMAVIAAMLAWWALVSSHATTSGTTAQERIFGIWGVSFAAGIGLRHKMKPKKGIVLTTMMLATIIFVVVVGLVLFLIFAGIQSSAGSTGGGFFYGAFDAIMGMLGGG